MGEQKSSDPTSGQEFRILVEAKSKRYGIVVRLVGNVSANTCRRTQTAVLNIEAQNGRSVKDNKFPLIISACGEKKHRK